MDIFCEVNPYNKYHANNVDCLLHDDCWAEIKKDRDGDGYGVFCRGEHFGPIGFLEDEDISKDMCKKLSGRKLGIKECHVEYRKRPAYIIFTIDECP